MPFLKHFNTIVFLVLTALYCYQMIYVAVALIWEKHARKPLPAAKKQHRYGAVIAARNEEAVIGQLIESIKRQSYPEDLIEIFVVADNCTDSTAEAARQAGAHVYERFHKKLIGKGYALDYLFRQIAKDFGGDYVEAYMIFDADNLLDEHYVEEMNKVFDAGYHAVTSYRNSKNYGDNWISAGYSLWFLREAKYLNNPRMLLGTCCAISGTGFLISSEIVRQMGGWRYHLLTEDIEFSIDSAIRGETIGYCGSAILYDEQPVTFRQSWTQRMRWCKGFYQVIGKYGGNLIRGIFRKENSFSCYDMLMTVVPATFLSLACIAVNGLLLLDALFGPRVLNQIVLTTSQALVLGAAGCYLAVYGMGLLTTITEWKRIRCSAARKILYTFTFPLFLATYVPICIAALFKKVDWKPITHTVTKSLDEVR